MEQAEPLPKRRGRPPRSLTAGATEKEVERLVVIDSVLPNKDLTLAT